MLGLWEKSGFGGGETVVDNVEEEEDEDVAGDLFRFMLWILLESGDIWRALSNSSRRSIGTGPVLALSS